MMRNETKQKQKHTISLEIFESKSKQNQAQILEGFNLLQQRSISIEHKINEKKMKT